MAKELYCCISPSKDPDHTTLRIQRGSSIREMIRGMAAPYDKWETWRKKGWTCVKVRASIIPLTPNS